MKTTRNGLLVATLGVILLAGATGCNEDGAAPASVVAPAGQSAELRAGGPPMPLLHRLDRALGLSADQRERIRAILAAERETLRRDGVFQKGPEEVRAAMEARREDVARRIEPLLTPDQRERFAALEARLREHLAGGVGHGEVLTRELGLSPAQAEQVKSLLAERRAAMQPLREQFRGEAGAARGALRERFRAERRQFHERLAALLTPEQREKLKALEAEWRPELGR